MKYMYGTAEQDNHFKHLAGKMNTNQNDEKKLEAF